MKKLTVLSSLIFSVSLAIVGITAFSSTDKASKVSAADLPTSFDLNDTSVSSIRSYYNGLSSKSSSELVGSNLLKNLKTILSANNTFYSYGAAETGVGAIYKITDRNWSASPASDISGYNASTNIISNYDLTSNSNNPYIINLYVSRDTSVTNNQISNPIQHHTGTSANFDKEHVWSVSYGFEAKQNAGTDLHHLIAADSYINRYGHSNNSYGYVDVAGGSVHATETATNRYGTPKTSYDSSFTPNYSETSVANKVFEVADEWKGDVARALLYMVARYNYLSGSGTPSTTEPNLELVPVPLSTTTTSSTSYDKPVQYGNIKDILAWHHADPVDQYEIHRNNLIYTNFQGNRNPFIDYPDWVDYVWNEDGSYKTTTTNYAKPASDSVYEYNSGSVTTPDSVSINKSSLTLVKGNTGSLVATSSGNVTWTSSNTSVVTVSGSGYNNVNATLTAKAAGTATITATVGTATATCSVTVNSSAVSVTSVSLNKTSLSLNLNSEETLTATVLPTNATNKNVTWSSSDSTVASVNSEGVVSGLKAGTATITVTTVDGSKTASCEVTVVTTASTTSVGFEASEGFAASSSYYNSSIKYAGNEGSQWGYLSGSPTSTSSEVLSGSQSMQLRWKTSAATVVGYTFMNYDVSNITSVSFKARETQDLSLALSYSSDSGSTWTVKQTFTLTTSTATYTCDLSNTSANRLKFAMVLPSTNPTTTAKLTIDDVEITTGSTSTYSASDFATEFLSTITCSGTGSVTSTSTSWTSMSSKYSSLSTTDKNTLKQATANQSGTTIEKCVARYDYIIKKYGTSTYTNFIGRTISAAPAMFKANADDNHNITIIVMVVMMTSSLGGYFLIRKRKEQ